MGALIFVSTRTTALIIQGFDGLTCLDKKEVNNCKTHNSLIITHKTHHTFSNIYVVITVLNLFFVLYTTFFIHVYIYITKLKQPVNKLTNLGPTNGERQHKDPLKRKGLSTRLDNGTARDWTIYGVINEFYKFSYLYSYVWIILIAFINYGPQRYIYISSSLLQNVHKKNI